MRTSESGLVLAMLLGSGCFQAEAPRPLPQAPDEATNAATETGLQPVTVTEEDNAAPAVTELAATLRNEADPAARNEAVYGLADAGTEADAGFVGQALADPDTRVRRAAVEALTGFGPEASVSYLALALNDADARVRQDAVEALGHVGTAEARQALQQGAIDMDPMVRAAAEQMLAEPPRKRR